jgi:Xaa-Pro aminopeptidase
MDLGSRISIVQGYLRDHHIDGWLIYSFQNLNSICSDLLSLPSHLHQSRKFLYFIPQRGEPIKIVHLIEKHLYQNIKGKELVYKSLEQWNDLLKELLSPLNLIACDYSPMGEIPTLSKIDAGTFEKIISLGVKVQSSGEIISEIFGVLSERQIALHRKAAQKLALIYEKIPGFVDQGLSMKKTFKIIS